jgi:transcription elongation factor Elf1
MSRNYTCPFCGAEDSTRCDLLPVPNPPHEAYTDEELEAAREEGCRVARYVDKRTAA